MTLLAHQTEVRFPSSVDSTVRVLRAPLVRATAETLAGFGEIVTDFATVVTHITPWPVSGWRPLSPGTGIEGGTTEGVFAVWREGGVLFGRNEAVGRQYILGWYGDPASSSRDLEPESTSRLLTHEANYHPDGGQIFFARNGEPYVVLLAEPGDDVRPEDFVAFYVPGDVGVQLLPGVWHHPPAPLGERAEINDRQGKVHACVDVDFLVEFNCYVEIPLEVPPELA
ncbi:MAG TPA: ureidoglycolate lyase [Ilumatobacteraceae bacterium]